MEFEKQIVEERALSDLGEDWNPVFGNCEHDMWLAQTGAVYSPTVDPLLIVGGGRALRKLMFDLLYVRPPIKASAVPITSWNWKWDPARGALSFSKREDDIPSPSLFSTPREFKDFE